MTVIIRLATPDDAPGVQAIYAPIVWETAISFGEFQQSSAINLPCVPLTQNLAKRAMVRSTISFNLETMIDLRLNRPNQCRCRQ